MQRIVRVHTENEVFLTRITVGGDIAYICQVELIAEDRVKISMAWLNLETDKIIGEDFMKLRYPEAMKYLADFINICYMALEERHRFPPNLYEVLMEKVERDYRDYQSLWNKL